MTRLISYCCLLNVLLLSHAFKSPIRLHISTASTIKRRSTTPLYYSIGGTLEVIRDSLTTPPDLVLKAVEKTSNYRLTVPEAASLTGLSLFQAKNGLMTLATLTGGDLEVTGKGDIIYSYPRNFREILNKRSFGQKLKNIWKFISPKLFYLVRISVGFFLFVSIAIATATFFAVLSTSSSSNSDSDSDRRSSSNRFVYYTLHIYIPCDRYFT